MKVNCPILLMGILATSLVAGCQTAGPAIGNADTAYDEQGNTGDVSFTLLPQGIENGQFVVDFRVDTHRGDLSEIDLRQAVKLHVGEMEYSPVEATSLTGHHVQGNIAFAIADAPEEFEIVITQVRDMGDLRFEWAS